ncbi:hypothetical protein BWD09_01985 [Neisseria dentiae]|uniref:Uncharacterized protein n=1 Tax=Neisseria dentiae TaxID=194197 RepID=A0A1X3DFS8_9NEIS|nr:hypothetical protein [Neisseria dentiae]OSI18561.1 hypothetical protein BWD09_01985 [Neisseria dentiae]QMT45547.1 hypothetical protein H3L92_01620 [Neisseria dentiae]
MATQTEPANFSRFSLKKDKQCLVLRRQGSAWKVETNQPIQNDNVVNMQQGTSLKSGKKARLPGMIKPAFRRQDLKNPTEIVF